MNDKKGAMYGYSDHNDARFRRRIRLRPRPCQQVLHVEADPRIDYVSALLPNYNCGGCGYAGCSALAEAMVEGEVSDFKCKPCKADKKAEIIDYLKTPQDQKGKR